MREEERANFARGGILADAMGLGELTCVAYIYAPTEWNDSRQNCPDHWGYLRKSLGCVGNVTARSLLTAKCR